MRWWSVALAAAAASGLLVANTSAADYYQQRLPDGVDTLMPRYYDYRAPRAYYPDEAPAALRLDGPVVVAPPAAVVPVPPAPPAPPYAPTGANLPPPAYPPPAYGYAAPLTPYPAANIRPICGVYRFWSGDRCIDARGD